MKKHTIAIIFLISAGLFSLLLMYHVQGPGWDLIAHYLNAKSFVQTKFISKNFKIWGGSVIQDGNFYIEIFRPITSSLLIIILLVFHHNSILAYIIVLYFMFMIAIWAVARAARADYLILYSVMISPYFIYASFIVNSEEILSLILVLFSIALLFKKNEFSGFVLGIASITQYTAPIFLPMLLLLREPKKIAVSLMLFGLALTPWLMFNYVYFGSPIASYISSFSINVAKSGALSLNLLSLLIVLIFPLIYFVFIILFFKSDLIMALDQFVKQRKPARDIVITFAGLSIVGYFVVALKFPSSDQIRLGYFVCASLLLFIAVLFQDKKVNQKIVLLIFSISIILSVGYIIGYGIMANSTHEVYYNVNSNSSIVANAVAKLTKLGYGNCKVISNSWIYLLYKNVKAYSPFSSNHTTNTTYPIVEIKKYPAVAADLIPNLNNSKVVYNNSNFSILIPDNVTCVQ